jgi:hypothetical protein
MDWFRVYDSIIDDPKIVQRSAEVRWFYVALLAVSSRSSIRGTLPDRTSIAFHLRIKPSYANRLIDEFIKGGLIDEDESTKQLTMHGWNKRQFKSDDVTARTRPFRERSGAVPRNVPGTPRARSETETETETEKNPPIKPPKSGGFVPPDCVTVQDWSDFEEMRRKIRKPLTDRGRRGVVKELLRLQGEGHPPDKVLEQSIRNDWQDVWPIRESSNGQMHGRVHKREPRINTPANSFHNPMDDLRRQQAEIDAKARERKEAKEKAQRERERAQGQKP